MEEAQRVVALLLGLGLLLLLSLLLVAGAASPVFVLALVGTVVPRADSADMSAFSIKIRKFLRRGNASNGGALLLQGGCAAVILVSELPDLLGVVLCELKMNSRRQAALEEKCEELCFLLTRLDRLH